MNPTSQLTIRGIIWSNWTKYKVKYRFMEDLSSINLFNILRKLCWCCQLLYHRSRADEQNHRQEMWLLVAARTGGQLAGLSNASSSCSSATWSCSCRKGYIYISKNIVQDFVLVTLIHIFCQLCTVSVLWSCSAQVTIRTRCYTAIHGKWKYGCQYMCTSWEMVLTLASTQTIWWECGNDWNVVVIS